MQMVGLAAIALFFLLPIINHHDGALLVVFLILGT